MRGEPVRAQPKALPRCLAKRQTKQEQEKAWQAVRKAVKVRDSFRCRVPRAGAFGGHEGPLEVHHLTPRSLGRVDSTANAILVCAFHHRLLQTRVIRAEFLSKRGADGPMAFSRAVTAGQEQA